MQTWLEFQGLLEDGHQEVGADRRPDLDAHGVVGGADERADAQVLFDPAKEQFDLPTRLVELGDFEGRQREVVGQENERVLVGGIDVTNPAQQVGVTLARIKAAQPDRLIAAQARGSVHGTAATHVRMQVRLGADDEESACLREASQPREVQIAAIHHVDRTGFDWKIVEQVDLVHRARRQSEKCRNRATQIQERVQFDRGLGRTKMSPGKKAQTQVDDRRIEGVDRLIEFERKRLRGVKLARSPNQTLGPVRVDAPIAQFVGLGESAAPDVAAKPHLIKQLGPRMQRRLQVAQALAKRELSKRHREPLIVTAKSFGCRIAVIALNAATKGLAMPKTHHLREDSLRSHPRRMERDRSGQTQNASHPPRRAIR